MGSYGEWLWGLSFQVTLPLFIKGCPDAVLKTCESPPPPENSGWTWTLKYPRRHRCRWSPATPEQ